MILNLEGKDLGYQRSIHQKKVNFCFKTFCRKERKERKASDPFRKFSALKLF